MRFYCPSIVAMHLARKWLKTGFNGFLGTSLQSVSRDGLTLSEVSANLPNFVK
jgi:hypothetical protein